MVGSSSSAVPDRPLTDGPWRRATVTRQCKTWAVGQSDPPPAQVQVGQGPVRPQRRPESKPPVVRADPDSIREAARIRVMKLEKALEVMGDSQGPAVECLRSELEKAKLASRRRPINVEVDECRKFIARSGKRIDDLDEERTQEMVSLTQGRARLHRLEAEQVSDSVAPPPQTIPPSDWQTEMDVLKAKLAAMEEERDEAVRDTARKRQAVGPRGRSIPAMAHFGPSGTRRLDAGPSFRSAGCHDRGGRSTSLGDHIEDGRRGRVFAANDRQFHGVMREDRSARSRDSRYGLRGVRVGEASNPGPVQTRQARRAEHDRVIADRRVVHREDDEPLQDTAPDSMSTIRSRRRRRCLRPLPCLAKSH